MFFCVFFIKFRCYFPIKMALGQQPFPASSKTHTKPLNTCTHRQIHQKLAQEPACCQRFSEDFTKTKLTKYFKNVNNSLFFCLQLQCAWEVSSSFLCSVLGQDTTFLQIPDIHRKALWDHQMWYCHGAWLTSISLHSRKSLQGLQWQFPKKNLGEHSCPQTYGSWFSGHSSLWV